MFKKYFSLNNLSTLILYLSILIFIIAFNFRDNPTGGWYQQFLPDLGNKQITDIEFLDSLTGFAVANQPSDTSYILKTTNGGDNWQIIYRNFFAMTRLQFLNLNTGYACGGYLYKTTDEGISWSQVNTPSVSTENMYVLKEDTIWFVNSDGLVGGVYRTTNGGTSWTRQLNLGTLNPENIYMFNKDIGFISKVNTGAPYTRKTTDGGQSWFVVVNNEGFTDMYFADSLIGWRANGTIKKTFNGGLNWNNQILPQGGNINLSSLTKFSNINSDSIWGVGGRIAYPNNQFRGIIFNTINGGENWGYQIPDTTINIFQYINVNSSKRLNIWSYAGITGVHTISGGDTTYYTSIKQISTLISKTFKLNQNFPNPFNPRTKIKFEMSKSGNTIINVYDVTGKQIETIVKSFLTTGEYETEFNGSNYTSGIYFYSMIVDGNVIDTKKMILLK